MPLDQERLREIVRETSPRLRDIAGALDISYSLLNAYLYREDVPIPDHVRLRLAQYLDTHGRRLQEIAETVRANRPADV